METVEIKSLKGISSQPPVKILVPHDASVKEFSYYLPDIYRELKDAVEVDEKTLQKFLTIEQDVFATEAAEQLARNIHQAFRGVIRVEIIKVLLPRGIVDMNRIRERAVWKLFDHEEHSYLKKELERLYQITYVKLQKAIRGTGILIDLHTMSPTDPWETIELHHQNVEAFINSWRHNPQQRRKNDLITIAETPEGEIQMGDVEIIEAVGRAFENEGIAYGKSETYRLNGIHLGTQWASLVPSYFNIDLTKDHGSKETVDAKNFDISELTYDEKKLERVTTALANAIGEVVKRRLSDPKVLVH